MDEFSPTYSARDEIRQRIDVLQTRADTYYTKRIAEAEAEVQRYRDGLYGVAGGGQSAAMRASSA